MDQQKVPSKKSRDNKTLSFQKFRCYTELKAIPIQSIIQCGGRKNPKLSSRYTNKIIEEKLVLLPQDFHNGL